MVKYLNTAAFSILRTRIHVLVVKEVVKDGDGCLCSGLHVINEVGDGKVDP